MLVPEVNDELCPFHCTAVRIVPHEPCVTQDLAQERKGTPGLTHGLHVSHNFLSTSNCQMMNSQGTAHISEIKSLDEFTIPLDHL